MAADSIENMEIVERATFTAESTPSLFLLLILCLGFTLALLLFLMISHSLMNPLPVFFPTTVAGQLIQEPPLDQPGLGQNVLFEWLTEGMMVVNSFNFVNSETVFDEAQKYFTPEGYGTYKSGLQAAGVIDKVINNKYVLRATPTSAPQITEEKVLANRYFWQVKLPMLFQYKSVDSVTYDNVDISIIIMRVPTTQSPDGVLILRYAIAAQALPS